MFDENPLIALGKATRRPKVGIGGIERVISAMPGYFFIVPPGVVASPLFSAEPAVPAPCVLAS